MSHNFESILVVVVVLIWLVDWLVVLIVVVVVGEEVVVKNKHFSVIFTSQFGLVLHKVASEAGNKEDIGLSFRHIFSKLTSPTNESFDNEIMLFSSSQTSFKLKILFDEYLLKFR